MKKLLFGKEMKKNVKRLNFFFSYIAHHMLACVGERENMNKQTAKNLFNYLKFTLILMGFSHNVFKKNFLAIVKPLDYLVKS